MMTRPGKRKSVDRNQYQRYERVGRDLKKATTDLCALADNGYGNAIAILSIFACIAYADALCIHFGGFKSTEGDHARVAHALREALAGGLEEGAAKRLKRVLEEKEAVSYQGDSYTIKDALRIVDDMVGFCDWAEKALR